MPEPDTSDQKACEPLHIQYSYDDLSVVVVNSTYEPLPDSMQRSCSQPRVEGVVQFRGRAQCGADSAQRVSPYRRAFMKVPIESFHRFDLVGRHWNGREP